MNKILAFAQKVEQLAASMGIELYDYANGPVLSYQPPYDWHTITFRELKGKEAA